MDRPDKPPKESFIIGPDPVEMARIRKVMDDWTVYIASRMTVEEMRSWLDANRWGGDNPYLRPRVKDGIARVVACMVLEDGFTEPGNLR